MTAPELARAARACVAVDVYENALALWMSFEAYARYDRLRGAGNAAVIEDIYSWSFAEPNAGVTETQARFTPGEAVFEDACARLLDVGPPAGAIESAAWQAALDFVGCSIR